jgi:hypothetical protein
MTSLSCIVALCTALASQQPLSTKSRAAITKSCIELAKYTQANTNADVLTVAAIAYTESGFRHTAVSSAGARGILQVLPKYWCKKGKLAKCNYLKAGLRAWRYYRKRSPTLRDALCSYASGKPCGSGTTRATRYADTVLRRINLGEASCATGC